MLPVVAMNSLFMSGALPMAMPPSTYFDLEALGIMDFISEAGRDVQASCFSDRAQRSEAPRKTACETR